MTYSSRLCEVCLSNSSASKIISEYGRPGVSKSVRLAADATLSKLLESTLTDSDRLGGAIYFGILSHKISLTGAELFSKLA
jgi:hypothetical protein